MKKFLFLLLSITTFFIILNQKAYASTVVDYFSLSGCIRDICLEEPPGGGGDVGLVGELKIFSDGSANSGSSGSGLSSLYGSHSFITFRNMSSSNITFGKYSVPPQTEITIGTFGNREEHSGVWYNLESHYISNYNSNENRVSISMYVNLEEISIINNYINNNDRWSQSYNCSSFAVGIWNSVSSTTLSAFESWLRHDTPKKLSESIKAISNYKVRDSIQYTAPYGYYSNTDFIEVTAY